MSIRIFRAYVSQPFLVRLFITLFGFGFMAYGGGKNTHQDSRSVPSSSRLRMFADCGNEGDSIPAETNRISFVKVSRNEASSNLSFTIYAPNTCPIDVFGRVHLDFGDWEHLGTINANHPFTETSVYSPSNSYFLLATRADTDWDNDGIPDGREQFVFHTNPLLWDSSGDGLSDGIKIYMYGLNPCLRDNDQDGYDDDEELISGQSPLEFTEGAERTVRYFYDEDGRLIGTYTGNSQGASTSSMSPAGNSTLLHERSSR